jgi:negative regulator of replication initiation
MEATCSTRAVKVLKYIQRNSPNSISRASLAELEKLPATVLSSAHTLSNWTELTNDEQLRSWLRSAPPPAAKSSISGPLFNGTLVFAQVSFAQPNLPPSGVLAADIQTAISYATLAAIPINRYASQYGPNWIRVWPVAIPFTANLQSSSFTHADFEGWVDDIGQFMRKQVSNPCIVIMHNRDLPNSASFTGERNSFHSQTSSGIPYCYSLVFGENLTVADNNHTFGSLTRQKVYAHNLSHEVAEMVVDPRGDDSNREVCDACSGNCNVQFFDLFDQNGVFMGGTTDTASATGFSFFINSIVSAAVAVDENFCVSPGANAQVACVYPPPFVSGQLYAYGDTGTPGNVSNPAIAGFDDWLGFKFLFAGTNLAGENQIYAVNNSGQLLSYGDDGTQGNVSAPTTVGFGGWQNFKFLFAGTDLTGANRIYGVDSNGQLLSYGDDGNPGNVSAPTVVGFGGWQNFKFPFVGTDLTGANRIYAVDNNGQLLSYGDDGNPGNVSSPVVVGFGGWLDFKFLFAGTDLTGANRIYAVDNNGQLLSYGDDGNPGNVSSPITVGFGGWLAFKFLFAGKNLAGDNRIYAVGA